MGVNSVTGERSVVQIIGDGMDGTWLTWRWNDPEIPVRVHRINDLAGALSDFHAALPGGSITDLSDQRLNGPLCDAAAELQLMTTLARALIPEQLLSEILAADHRISVRVMPSPPLARVPWGLLPINEDGRRLIEVADVSWIGPILPRDTAAGPTPESQLDHASPVYVLDPYVYRCKALLPKPITPHDWQAERPGAVILERFSGEERVLDELQDEVSRLFLLGHATQVPSRPGETEFLIGKDRLSPADVLSAAWPVPSRAAIVACASGTDLESAEPLGLATSFLLRGAETVQATLWPIPTETALTANDRSAAGAFIELVGAFDRAQEQLDPIQDLCDYQRQRLQAWREQPTLRNSPILWGAAMTLTAPRHRHLAVEDSQ